MLKNKEGQIAIEFLLLTTFALFFLAATLIVLSKISSDNQNYRVQTTIQDLGISIKNEFVTASEMEKGYSREITLPRTVSGKSYSMTIDDSLSGNSYLIITSDLIEMYFSIPKASGTIAPGNNLISKQDNLTITHLS
jgi:hypothetical protein